MVAMPVQSVGKPLFLLASFEFNVCVLFNLFVLIVSFLLVFSIFRWLVLKIIVSDNVLGLRLTRCANI